MSVGHFVFGHRLAKCLGCQSKEEYAGIFSAGWCGESDPNLPLVLFILQYRGSVSAPRACWASFLTCAPPFRGCTKGAMCNYLGVWP